MSSLDPMIKTYGTAEQGAVTKFEKKKEFHDLVFALLFVAHLVVIIIVLVRYHPESDQDWTDAGVYSFVGITAGTAIVLSTLGLAIVSACAKYMVELALVAYLGSSLTIAIKGFVAQKIWLGVVGLLIFAIGLSYTCYVWKKIPFAAANLRTAISAVRTNIGLVLVAYFWLAVALAWILLWLNAAGSAMSEVGWGIVFLYLLSFFWVSQVIYNIVHVIVSSVIGTWWYNPIDANFCWDDGLNEALCHAVTYNLGSICFGSLIAAFVQALKYFHRMVHSSDKCSCLYCCIDCILGCIQSLIEYFNKWAYTYVGIHGESYIESGKAVMALFAARGWSAIITDALSDVVMWMLTLSVTLLTGLAGWASVNVDDDMFTGIGIDHDEDDAVAFILGALIGYLLSSIVMGVVKSAVDAVIVCFAEAPAVFHENYPELCLEMLTAWKAAYPGECADDFDSVKV